MADSPRETIALAEALIGVMCDGSVDLSLRLACTDFLGFLGAAEPMRDRAGTLLVSVLGTDLDLQSKRALQRMEEGPAWTG
jgi:hypothetical protein